jgi:hypothetical protein
MAWPLGARAQQAGKVRRIGFLGSATAAGSANTVESLRTGLSEFGYVEGTNIVTEFRWAEGRYDRLPRLVAELIATNVDLLITHGTPGTRAAKQVLEEESTSMRVAFGARKTVAPPRGWTTATRKDVFTDGQPRWMVHQIGWRAFTRLNFLGGYG